MCIGIPATPLIDILGPAPVLAASAAASTAGVHRYLFDRRAPRAVPFVAAAIGAGAIPLGSALRPLGGAGPIILLVMIGLGTILGIRWAATTPLMPGEGPPEAETAWEALVRGAPSDVLFREWRDADHEMIVRSRDPGPARRSRRLVVDELRRRHPERSASWPGEV